MSDKKTILITGASSGVGQETARHLVKAGYAVYGTSRNPSNSSDIRGITSITNPVLVIWGRQDNLIPVAHADIAAKGFPNVRVQIIDNCGHFPMLEHASEFNRLLLDFLSD